MADLKFWEARILSVDFYRQRADSGMAHEFKTLCNAVSYLHDISYALTKLSVARIELVEC